MRAIVYTRQSVDRSGEALGVARQRDDCLALAEARGWTIVATLTDNDTSAAGGKTRPGFDATLRALENGEADAVVAWSLDRLTRNRRDTLRLVETCEKAQATVALVRGSDLDMSTPSGRLVADLLAATARAEIDVKSDRQRRAVEQAVAQGRRVGGRRAFGFELDMTPRPAEAAAVRWAYDALLSGASLGTVARNWNARGLHTPQGRRDGTPAMWIPQVVSRTLRKAAYAGLRSHKGKVVGPAAWSPLVEEGVWRAAQAVLADPARRTPGGPRALLTGLAMCGVCGATVHGGGGKAARNYRVYRCRTMTHVNRRAEPVDDYVSAVVIERLSRPDAVDLLTARDRPDMAELHTEADRLRQRIDALADEYAADAVTLSQMTKATARLRAKLDGVEAQMADAARVDILGPLLSSGDVRKVWDSLDVDRKRAVIDLLMAAVMILPPGRGARIPDFDSQDETTVERIGATVAIEWRQT